MYNFYIETNNLLSKLLRKYTKTFTYWRGNVERRPYKTEKEQIICVLYGSEEYMAVSPIYMQNIYVG